MSNITAVVIEIANQSLLEASTHDPKALINHKFLKDNKFKFGSFHSTAIQPSGTLRDEYRSEEPTPKFTVTHMHNEKHPNSHYVTVSRYGDGGRYEGTGDGTTAHGALDAAIGNFRKKDV